MANTRDKIYEQPQTPVNIRSVSPDVFFPVSPSNPIDESFAIADALNRIYAEFGDVVSVKNKAKDLIKYGRNQNVQTTSSTIWVTGRDQQNETYVADNANLIDSISSSTGDVESMTVEGHTMTGGNKTFVVQTVTLQGTTRVPLPIPLNRCTRAYNNNSVNLTGFIYIYENTAIAAGKPIDTTKIHLTIRAGKNQSEKCSTSLSSTDYWLLTRFRATILEKAANIFADVALEVRLTGKVFRERESAGVNTGGTTTITIIFEPYLIVPPNSDIRLAAIASANGTDVAGSIQGFLAS